MASACHATADMRHQRSGAAADRDLVEPVASPAAAQPAPGSRTGPGVPNRGAITACVILAVVMQALDTTIANVALPYIQGSVSASADQINWVLTSYITAAAIMTPAAGYCALKFGRKRTLLVSVGGFVVASVLCGIAQSLMQIVGFRLLQGMFGAALFLFFESLMIEIYTPEERGSAMAVYGVSIMVGPVLGPVIGGWLTDNISWRWVFYINVGIGAVAILGISAFVNETKRDITARLDWTGFAALGRPSRRCRSSWTAASSSTGFIPARSRSRRWSRPARFTCSSSTLLRRRARASSTRGCFFKSSSRSA